MKWFWRWTGAIFFALVFIFLVLTGIGTSLPIDHHAACSSTYDKPVSFVFAAVENDDTSVLWRPEIARAVLVSGRGPTAVWRETDIHGNLTTYRTAAYVYGHKLARTIDYVPGMPFAGTWTSVFLSLPVVEQEPMLKTQLIIIEDGKIYNPFFRFLARYVLGYTQSMRTYLEDLAKLSGKDHEIKCIANP